MIMDELRKFTQDEIDAAEPKIDLLYYPEIGDICSHCQTEVRIRWDGIACDCGRTWFCY